MYVYCQRIVITFIWLHLISLHTMFMYHMYNVFILHYIRQTLYYHPL